MLKISSGMRNTRQSPTRLEGNDNPTLQILIDTINALQETMAVSKADQDRLIAEVRDKPVLRQDQFRAELDASRAINKELRKAN